VAAAERPALEIRVRRLPHGEGIPLPERASEGSAGFDLRAAVTEPVVLAPGERRLVPTGLAFAIPPGWEGQVRPRSGLALRHGLTVLNSPGTVDSDYRGEVAVILWNGGTEAVTIGRGDRIAQLLLARVPDVRWVEVAALPDSERGGGGFGSSGSG
jgi:dUTP pyrophosphatase